MLVAAALCPHPPLIVPEIASGAASELDDLRAACDAAVEDLLAARPDSIVVIGNGPESVAYGPGVAGDFHRFGIRPVGAGGAHRVEEPAGGVGGGGLPLSLTIGAWLLDRSGAEVPRRYVAIGSDEPAVRAAARGADLVAGAGRIALLAMGDGSARRTESSPGPFHPAAEAFDTRVSAALRAADLDYLLGIDEETCRELWAGGRVAWQALAGVLDPTAEGEVRYDAAPYGIGYLVVSWRPKS